MWKMTDHLNCERCGSASTYWDRSSGWNCNKCGWVEYPRKEVLELAPRQRDIFLIIRDYIETVGWAPSVRDICDESGLSSTSTVHHHIQAIARKGYLIVGQHNESRAMALTTKGKTFEREGVQDCCCRPSVAV